MVQEVNPNLYSNGSPFLELEKLDFNLHSFLREVDGKKACVLVVGGSQSSAKTTLGVHLVDRINFFTGFPILDLSSMDSALQYCQGSKNFLRRLNELKDTGRKIIVWDETAADYRRKRAISNINKTLDESMDMLRRFKIIVVLVYHDFTEIPTELIKKKVVTCLFQNSDRDINKDFVISKAYNYGKMLIIKHNMIKSIIPEYAFSIEPNFSVHFKDLSPERSKQLEILSTNIKDKIFERAEISLQGYLCQDDLSAKLGMSKAWVRQKIKLLNIESVRRISNVTYYDAKVLERLKNQIKRR